MNAVDLVRIAKLRDERDTLRASHERLRLELELLKRRTFVAKAEWVELVAPLFEKLLAEGKAERIGHEGNAARERKRDPRLQGVS